MKEELKAVVSEREAGMMVTTGRQGVGKTYQNMSVIYNYSRDKLENKVRASKSLIMDTNGEYTKDQFEKNGIKNFEPKMIAVKDIPEWSLYGSAECRRIDAKSLSIAEKKSVIQSLVRHYRNGLLVMEDINTYILNVTHMENIVSGLVNLRHRAVDVLISYQSLRAVEPRMFTNARWIRMHKQNDNVMDIKGKIPDLKLYKIAQIIVDMKYRSGDERFFLYIDMKGKIFGPFSKKDFKEACMLYYTSNQRQINEYKMMFNVSKEKALEMLIQECYQEMYANPNK